MRIRWEEDALSDLVALRKYIAQDNPAAAHTVAERILTCVNLLAAHPLAGEPGRIHTTRELVVNKTPYTIIYQTTADMVTILRVFHQARKWSTEP